MSPINVKYKSNLEKDIIEKAIFQVEEEKFLELSVIDIKDINDPDKVIRQDLKILIKDLNYGEEEMFVDLSADLSRDISKIMTKIVKQVNVFKIAE